MILCRLYVGSVTVPGQDKPLAVFSRQGQHQTVYVLDELALKSYNKHKNITGAGENSVEPSRLPTQEFRTQEGYDIATYFDKFVRPVILQEHFGIRTQFNNDPEFLTEFARNYVVAVNVPDDSRSIPVGSTGVLLPKPYGPGAVPSVARFTESVKTRPQ